MRLSFAAPPRCAPATGATPLSLLRRRLVRLLVAGAAGVAACGCTATPEPRAAAVTDAPPTDAAPPGLTRIETLGNGMRLVRIEQEALPLVTFVIGLAAGSAHDGVENAGLAGLMLDLVWMGEAELSERQVQEALDQIGGRVGAEVAAEHAIVHLACLAADAARGLQLLQGALLQPRFVPDVVAREREQALARLAQAHHDPGWLANDAYVRDWLGSHPYAAALAGPTAASLQRVTVELVRAEWARRVRPEQATLILLGPRDAALDAQVRETFAGWKVAPIASEPAAAEPAAAAPAASAPAAAPAGLQPLPPVPTAPPSTRILRVPRPDMGQIWLQFGALGIARDDPRRPAVILFQQSMAGGFTSVLVDQLRVDRGLVYGISMSQPWLSQPAPYSLVTSTRAEKVGEVLAVTEAALRAVRERPPTAAQVEAARNTWLVAQASRLQTPLGLGEALYEGLLYDGDLRAPQHLAERVRALSAADVAAAAVLFDPDAFVVAMVGEAAALQQAQVPAPGAAAPAAPAAHAPPR